MSNSSESDASRNFGGKWTTEVPSVLDGQNPSRIQAVLSGELVFGLHMHYFGGRGADPIVFRDWTSFLVHVTDSRPGDRFLLWSTETLRTRDKLLGEKRPGWPQNEAQLVRAVATVEDYLSKREQGGAMREVFVARSRIIAAAPECLMDDKDILDRLEAFLNAADGLEDSWFLAPFTEIDAPENAKDVLVDAKRSDHLGAVPLGGYY